MSGSHPSLGRNHTFNLDSRTACAGQGIQRSSSRWYLSPATSEGGGAAWRLGHPPNTTFTRNSCDVSQGHLFLTMAPLGRAFYMIFPTQFRSKVQVRTPTLRPPPRPRTLIRPCSIFSAVRCARSMACSVSAAGAEVAFWAVDWCTGTGLNLSESVGPTQVPASLKMRSSRCLRSHKTSDPLRK